MAKARQWQCVLAVLAAASGAGSSRAADWLQFGYDANHSANNVTESTIGSDNVSLLSRVYGVSIIGTDGSPVFLGGVATSKGVRDVLFMTTVNGVLAVDAATGGTIWMQSAAQFEYSQGASPAIDPGRQYVYGPASNGRIHKLNVADGSEVTDANWPIVSSLKPALEKASSPLAIATTSTGAHYLYSVTSSFNDIGDYQGHLTAINLDTAASAVFNAMCSDLHVHFIESGTPGVDDCATSEGGIWGRGGVTYSPYTHRIYFTTGNGVFDANSGGRNWGDTVLALNPDGTGGSNGLPLDSYTPASYQSMYMYDQDFGSSSPAVLPPVSGSSIAHLGMQVGKDGGLRLLDMDNLSTQGGPGHVAGEVQNVALIPGGFGNHATPQPAVWTNVQGDGSVWVFAAAEGVLSGLQMTVVAGQPLLVSRWSKTSMSVSSSPIVANDVLYSATAGSTNATIAALDPTTGNTLWTSPQIAGCCHTQGPIVVNGRLYVAGSSSVNAFSTVSIFRNGFE